MFIPKFAKPLQIFRNLERLQKKLFNIILLTSSRRYTERGEESRCFMHRKAESSQIKAHLYM